MEKAKETLCLNALSNLLDTYIDDACYCLRGSKESAVCLESVDNEWTVYDKERNAKDDEMHFDNIVEACLEMIVRLFKRDDITSAKNKFLSNIVGTQKIA